MRKTKRLFSQVGPEERVAQAIVTLPPSAQWALAEVADREDLPLVAGSWAEDDAGCLVANVVRLAGSGATDEQLTLDIRVLDLFPEMSSRDLNRLIVAWDEAALQEGKDNDAALRRLLRGALARAGVPTPSGESGYPTVPDDPPSTGDGVIAPEVPSRA